MSLDATTDLLAAAEEALASGDWGGARAAFEEVLQDAPSAKAEDGLGRALWWLQDTQSAISHVERAYAGYREAGDIRRAAASALWLSREFAAAYGNDAVSSGWIARAEGLLRSAGDVPEQGWLSLSRAERATAPGEIGRYAGAALEVARRLGDADLEAAALVRAGYAEVAIGSVEAAWRWSTRPSQRRPAGRCAGWRRSAT